MEREIKNTDWEEILKKISVKSVTVVSPPTGGLAERREIIKYLSEHGFDVIPESTEAKIAEAMIIPSQTSAESLNRMVATLINKVIEKNNRFWVIYKQGARVPTERKAEYDIVEEVNRNNLHAGLYQKKS